jgi:hypothetical protein
MFAAAVGRGLARLVPAGRREWVEAVWSEAQEVPSGLARLVWRAGCVRLVARELLVRRQTRNVLIFCVAAASIAWEVWPGSTADFSTRVNRLDVVAMVVLLVVLTLAARLFLGPSEDSRIARFLRIGAYVGFLALIPAKANIERFAFDQPRGSVSSLLYRAIGQPSRHTGIGDFLPEILFLVFMGLFAVVILSATSRRSRIARTTLVFGTSTGLLLGIVMYVVAPLGLSKAATNPWLPGSYIDPFVVLAWLLVLFGPLAAGVLAFRSYTAGKSAPPPKNDLARQVVAAGLLANIVGALLVMVLGSGTTALMINATWFRNWLYHGSRLLFGVSGLRPVLQGNPQAITYSHQITAVSDSGVFLAICVLFFLIAVLETHFIAVCIRASVEQDNPQQGGGNDQGPDLEPAPEGPGGVQVPEAADHEVDPAMGVLSLHYPLPNISQEQVKVERDRVMVGTTRDR